MPDLYWFDQRTHAGEQLRIVAKPGMTRTLYELDAPARLFLSIKGLDFIKEKLLPGFFHEGPTKRQLSVDEALSRIRETNPKGVVYDVNGNQNGIRRYVIAIHAPDGQFRYLLSIAEPAATINDQPEHMLRMEQLLKEAKEALANII